MNAPTSPGSTLSVTTALNGAACEVRLAGTADMHAIESLARHLSDVHEQTREAGCAHVRVDMRELEFMNSSCLKCFVSWIASVQALEPRDRYGIVFFAAPGVHWQRRSLNALRCFATETVVVTTAQPA